MLKQLTVQEKLYMVADAIEQRTDKEFCMSHWCTCICGFSSMLFGGSYLDQKENLLIPGREQDFNNLICDFRHDSVSFDEYRRMMLDNRCNRELAASQVRKYADGEAVEYKWLMKG